MSTELIQAYGTKISALFAERMRLRGTLESQVYKASPKLPRRVRKAAKSVAETLKIAENPKLARMVDEKALRQAGDLVIDHLEAIDPWDQFKGKVLGWLGWVSGIAIVIFICTVWYARQQGWI